MARRVTRALALVVAGIVSCGSSAYATAGTPRFNPKPTGIPGSWALIWHDTFKSKKLNSQHWSVGWPGSETSPVQATNSHETVCYTPSRVKQPGDGSLHLSIVKQPSTCSDQTQPYSAASVVTYGKFAFTYGAVQARVYLPGDKKSGLYDWPNFWGNGTVLDWPAGGENDTFEGLHGRGCWHFHSSSADVGRCLKLMPGWHTVASDWEPGRITYYFDGKKVGAVTDGVTASPQYLVLQMTTAVHIGGVFKPAAFLVDYVRVWQHP